MPSNQTQNYKLNQWERTDKIQMDDFNADNAKIDAALGSLEQTVTAHAALLPKLGNCAVETFHYVGDGQCGASHPTRLTFSKPPLLFLVYSKTTFVVGIRGTVNACIINGESFGASVSPLLSRWSGNDVFLTDENAARQLNYYPHDYYVVGFIDMDAE